MSTLEYCRQHNFTGTYQKPCEYWDAVSLMKRTTEGTLVPTRAMTFMQQRGCIPSEKNDWSCGGPLYQFMTSEHKTEEASDENSYARPIRDVFIADVDRFKLLLDHSAHSDAGVSAYSFEMAGQWLYCNDPDKGDEQCTRSPLICDETACPEGSISSADLLASQDVPVGGILVQNQSATVSTNVDVPKNASHKHVLSTRHGDVITVSQLLSAAGVNLDMPESQSNETFRSGGFALVVRILYSNDEPWIGMKVFPWRSTGPPMHYTYHIRKHATALTHLREVVSENVERGFSNETRIVNEYHGVLFIVEQYGSIKVWDTTHLLVILTTTLALLAVANCILEVVAMRCLDESTSYEHLKYESP